MNGPNREPPKYPSIERWNFSGKTAKTLNPSSYRPFHISPSTMYCYCGTCYSILRTFSFVGLSHKWEFQFDLHFRPLPFLGHFSSSPSLHFRVLPHFSSFRLPSKFGAVGLVLIQTFRELPYMTSAGMEMESGVTEKQRKKVRSREFYSIISSKCGQ